MFDQSGLPELRDTDAHGSSPFAGAELTATTERQNAPWATASTSMEAHGRRAQGALLQIDFDPQQHLPRRSL